jgi:hypothetical protein
VISEEFFDANASDFANELVVVRNYFVSLLSGSSVSALTVCALSNLVLPVIIEVSPVTLSDEVLDFFD